MKWVGMDSCGSAEVSQQHFASDSSGGVEGANANSSCLFERSSVRFLDSSADAMETRRSLLAPRPFTPVPAA